MVTVVSVAVARNGGVLTPEDLPALVSAVEKNVPDKAYQGLVVVSGRLPVWAFAAVVHALHPSKAVATFDPRLGGGVVVESHTTEYSVGQVVSTEGAETVSVEF